ncbi:MAG: hypothetical protein LPK21_09855 [Hymenobacteraceae bacterium]|nr:hypothetical protein [Hymenobacteraceae bacterium]MDX5512550.1 hypothetical protein [Hymenobacteraceae bacterium]
MTKKPPIDLAQFAALAAEIIAPVLAEAGFVPGQLELTTTYCLLPYLHQNRYIIVKADAHPGNSYFNILLGEGTPEWPDAEWQSVALWRVQQAKAPATNAGEYALTGSKDITPVLQQAATDLKTYASDFLKGDATLVKQLRNDQVKEQQPFKLAQKDKKGVLQKLLEQQQQAERDSAGNATPDVE